jgi:hypothetical protein
LTGSSVSWARHRAGKANNKIPNARIDVGFAISSSFPVTEQHEKPRSSRLVQPVSRNLGTITDKRRKGWSQGSTRNCFFISVAGSLCPWRHHLSNRSLRMCIPAVFLRLKKQTVCRTVILPGNRPVMDFKEDYDAERI